MGRSGTASAGALGGSANERATELRAYIGALLATAVIRDEPLTGIGIAVGASARAKIIRAEGDEAVDDLVVVLEDNSRVLLQVKLKAALTRDPRKPFGKALAQFIGAVRDGLGQDDQLVLASAESTRPLQDLAVVLDRERLKAPGGRTPREQLAINAFCSAATQQGATDTECAEILKRLRVWRTDPTSGDAAAALAARLDRVVTAVGKGAMGARALADVVRELAQRRGGLDGIGLVRALAVREVQLADGVDGADTVAKAHALDRYERLTAEIGSTLRLIGVRGDLAELPFEQADAQIEVVVADEDRGSGRELELAYRRRGRVILEGNPGGGKSTALRRLGMIAASREDWPVPVRVHLQQLAKAPGSLTAAVLAAVCDDLPANDAAALSAALGQELAAGNLMLLLDGLDEVRAGRRVLIERLVDWIRGLPAGVEIVIATRPSACSDAAMLGFPNLRLQAPREPLDLADAILAAIRPATSGDDWTDTRRGWLKAAFDRDSQLAATPLSIVVMTLIAARSRDPSTLPTVRAEILRRVLEDIVSGWELEYRQRGAATIGPLEGSRAEEALMIAFRTLGCAAIFAEPPTRTDAENQVTARLRDEFPLQPADGRAASRDAIAFWDEVGLISFDAGVLRLTLRPFGELAAAWDVALRDEAERRVWVAEARDNNDMWETLGLASALAPDVAAEWAAAIERDGREEELAKFAALLRDGMPVSQSMIDAVGTSTGDRLLASQNSVDKTARILLGMPLSDDAKEHLRSRLSIAAPSARALLIEALAVARWNEVGPEADERLRACLRDGRPEPPKPRPAEPNTIVIPERDPLYDDAMQAAAKRLARGSRADAELVMEILGDGREIYIEKLGSILAKGGHHDLAAEAHKRKRFGSVFDAWKGEDFEGAERRLLNWVSSVARPAELQPRQRRRLDELADLFETAGMDWIRPSWTIKRAALAEGWIQTAAILGGFDLGVVAAQAEIVLDDMGRQHRTGRLVYDGGVSAKLDRWDRVENPPATLRHLVSMLGVSSHEVMGRVGSAIAYAPDELDAVTLLDERLSSLLNWSRWYVSYLTLALASDGDKRAIALATDPDPLMRASAAKYLASRYLESGGKIGSEVFDLAADGDEGVRKALLDGFAFLGDRLDDRARAAARELGNAQRQPWVCRYCGAPNPPQPRTGCVDCSTSGPDIAGAVRDLLEHSSATHEAGS